MKKILAFTLAILLGLPGLMAWGQTDEGYGEDEKALGQFVDSFEDLGNVSVRVSVERNATLNAMELNYTLGTSEVLENYTEYVELDPNGRFTVNDYSIVVESFDNFDEDHRITYDFGAGFFTDFSHDVDVRIRDNSGNGGNDRLWAWSLANISEDGRTMDDNNDEFIGVYFSEFDTSDPDQPNIHLREYVDSVLFADSYLTASLNTWYYLKITKLGTALKCGIYSTNALRDAGDGTDGDIDNLAITLHADYNFRYLYAINSHFDGFSIHRLISGDIHNLTISDAGGYNSSGYFTTIDYLQDPLANGSALVAMINSSIPANTDIQLQFSNDNATWGDNQGIPGDSMDLVGGFESIDLRDLNYSTGYYCRFNLSSNDVFDTPRVYQNRLITMQGLTTIINQTINPINGTWVYYNLTAIANITGVHDSGTLASTYFIDGDIWNCSEVVGVPGYQVNFNATGIDTEAISLWFVAYVYYDGSASHEVNVELWNFTSSAFVELGEIPDMLGFAWMNFTVYGMRVPLDFVNSTGAIVGRLYHADAGNINHDINFDRINILAFVPTGLAVGGAGAGANWGLLWFFLILICVPIIFTLKKGTGR